MAVKVGGKQDDKSFQLAIVIKLVGYSMLIVFIQC